MNALHRRRIAAIAWAATLGLGSTAAVRGTVRAVPWLAEVELRLSPNRSLPPAKDIVVITVQKGTLRELGIERSTAVLPRRFQARLVRGLRRAGARVVLFDFDFSEEGDSGETTTFVRAIQEAAPLRVVLGLAPDPEAEHVRVEEQASVESVQGPHPTLVLAPETTFSPNFASPPILPDHVSIGSLVPWNPDRILRGLIVQYRDRESGQVYPHVAVAAALSAGGMPNLAEPLPFDAESHEFRAGPYRWRVGTDMEYRARWTDDPRPFPRYEYAEALRLLALPNAHAQFGGKIVVVGSDVDSKERFQTEGIGNALGVDVVAQFVNSLRAPSGSQFALTSEWANGLWCIVLGLIAALAVGSLRLVFVALGFFVGIGVAVAAPGFALETFGVRIDALAPILVATLSAAAMATLSGIGARRLDSTVGRVPGRPVEAAILFVDLKGSTAAISEMDLDDSGRMLHQVLETLVRTIRESGGRVERTMGDGAMAMWFRPEPRPWTAFRSPDAHLDACLRTIPKLNRAFEVLDARLQASYDRSAALTIGAEVGTIVGDIVRQRGHEEWSWFGIPIHLAARLQSKCGDLGVGIALGPELCARARGRFAIRFVAEADLKGIPGLTAISTLE